MDTQRVVAELKRKYPGKNIIINDPDNPTEVICEIEPGSLNSDRSVTIAVLDGVIKHPHGYSKVNYEVLKGILEVTRKGKTYFLHEGEDIDIEPGEYHLARGRETWVMVTSEPSWKPEEHLVLKENSTPS